MKSAVLAAASLFAIAEAGCGMNSQRSWSDVMGRINRDYAQCASVPPPPSQVGMMCIADGDFGCRRGRNPVGGLLYRDCCGG